MSNLRSAEPPWFSYSRQKVMTLGLTLGKIAIELLLLLRVARSSNDDTGNAAAGGSCDNHGKKGPAWPC